MSEKIIKLTEFQHARQRTEMFLSSREPHTQGVISYETGRPTVREMTWIPAVFTAFREILDNSLDEVVTHAQGDRIDISYNPGKMTFSVSDNGRGIPIDKANGQYMATMALTETKAGRNFGERGASRGLNGVGASVVNFCSEWFKVQIVRDGKMFEQMFHEGTGKNKDLVIEEPMITFVDKGTPTGTRIEFKLSDKVFTDNRLPLEFVTARVFEVALCYPKMKVFFNGEKINPKTVEKTIFGDQKPIQFNIEKDNFVSKFWLLPMFFEDGTEYTHSLVNAIPVFQGGTHIDAFKRCFFANMLTALERESKKRKLTPNRSDLIDGMLIFNITEMEAPTFDGQSKTRIVNEGIGSSIKTEMDDPEFFKKIMKSNPEWIEAVYARCAERTMKKDAIDISKLVKKGRTKVANLTDATSSDRSKCILMLTEGLSAAAGCITIRDPAIHGVLPLRGKVLNVYDQPLKTIIENEAISSIVRAIGLIPGQAARRGQLRYGKVYITVDADQDGANIACLLMLLFQKLWPDLFDSTKEPFLYMFQTPLLIAVKKNIRHYWFEDNIETFDPVKFQSFKITRAKGLGSLDQQSWGDCMKNPKLTAITEDGNLSETLAMIFDPKRADDRKDWMGI